MGDNIKLWKVLRYIILSGLIWYRVRLAPYIGRLVWLDLELVYFYIELVYLDLYRVN